MIDILRTLFRFIIILYKLLFVWFLIIQITYSISLNNSVWYLFLFFQVCAIVGGTFTVAGIIDSLVFTATGLFKKAQLGKLN